MRYTLVLTIVMWYGLAARAHQPEFSTAGFYKVDGYGREVYSMNVAWRFFKGKVADAHERTLDDKAWQVVSVPHGIEYLPVDASGCINYQGEVWYRKHFTPDNSLKDKKLFLYFEAIMGKSKVWVNGKLLVEHFGGYLPVIADITDAVEWGADNVISVWADNSNDPDYLPGKPQNLLDFTYFGGIYRDCWLVAHHPVYITDPNYENREAGGGLFVTYDKVSEQQATVILKTDVRNATDKDFAGSIEYELRDKVGKTVASLKQKLMAGVQDYYISSGQIKVKKPDLWSPNTPNLYHLYVRVKDSKGKIVDGYRRRIGIRSLEFEGKDGFWLNGKSYGEPLIGANRHQDFAVIGNALPNSLHWRDAKKLRDAGLKVIRNAHYPQDPAFMDACDELGLFVIVNTPGWQFWSDMPEFEQRVYADIRNMVRRDRNHPSVWLWEPTLNETWYPDTFAKNTVDIVHREYPYPSCYCACDYSAKGNEHFPVLFSHPLTGDKQYDQQYSAKAYDPAKCYFTREWGDCVDDWNSHNSPSRVNRAWGEAPMLVQAMHYARTDYTMSTYDVHYKLPLQHIGGCLWHSFDHQRGYHPDPFYGGIMDAFRQTKYSYDLFRSQRSPVKAESLCETGPMVYIAHEMTPFSPKDVTVFSNCEQVRLTVFEGGRQYLYSKESKSGMPYPVITFESVYDFMQDKMKSEVGKQDEVYMLAEGFIDGRVVVSHKVAPARRPQKLLLWADFEGIALKADGSDIVTVVAAIADDNGNIKRLSNESIVFTIEGEGRLLGNNETMTNPRPILWGTAPVLVQSTTKTGTIRITAHTWFEGSQKPVGVTLELHSESRDIPLLFDSAEAEQIQWMPASDIRMQTMDVETKIRQKKGNDDKLKEVEQQQAEFGE